MKLVNKKALITGASRGIGKAIAIQLAKAGCAVGIHYHDNKAEAEAVLVEIVNSGGSGFLFQADFAQSIQVAALAEDSWNSMQGFDFLINNVGVSIKKPFLKFTEQEVDAFHQINYKSAFILTQIISRKMIETNTEGSIYSITSVNAIRPGIGQAVHGASKSALETLMKGVALELAPHNIKVNTFALGAIETDMTAAVTSSPEYFKEVKEGIPLGRFGQPEEVATVVVDLIASGSYLTGATITLDGGLLLMRGYGKPNKRNNL